MAVVKGSVIGFLSGKLGQLVARTTKGRTILSARPASFNVSYVPALVEIRKKFANTVAFTKALLKLSALYDIWKAFNKGTLSVFNFVFQRNFGFSSAEKPTTSNIITPEGFPTPVDSVVLAADKVTVQLLALDTRTVITAAERDLSANGLICYYNPTDEADKPFEIISLNDELAAFDMSMPYTLEHNLDVSQQLTAAKYQNSITYFVVATKDSTGKIVQYSDTYALDN